MTRTLDRITRRLNTTAEQRRDGGFTLIELLIVIVILGILAGIAIFAAGTFSDDATQACEEANARIQATVDAAAAAGATGLSATGADCT